ncbi:hypothetical protein A2U01_0096425, partial [Trifolium medium]|nr:hypothetical protein [Trifolium medium]
ARTGVAEIVVSVAGPDADIVLISLHMCPLKN